MGATEFNYVVNVDTSRVMGSMAEVQNRMGMAMMPQGGGMGSVVGGAASGIGAMTRAMVRFPMGGGMGYGGTFTDPGIAYSPHYGMPQAYTTPGMERLIDRHGLSAAAQLRPPGVSPGDFFMEVQANKIERDAEARRQGFVAARTTAVSGVSGLVAGGFAAKLGAPLGGAIGKRLGGDFGGKVGRVAGGLGAFMLADSIVSGAVQEHYAEVERIGGVTTEFGEILGAGRGLTRVNRYKMGIAAREAAGDLNMDVQMMGDVLAGARQAGMLPRTTNPNELREQIKDLASTIDEAAQKLGTSMGNATQVIKGMTNMGFGGAEGVDKLINMAGSAGVSPMAMYGAGMQGASIARRIEMNGRAGFDLFTDSVMSAAGAGLSRRELGYVGGTMGLGRQIAMTQMGHAVSSYGDMQLMAMASGQGLPSDPFETAAMAMQQLSKGGDFIGNAIQFSIHKRELREGLGKQGIQQMTRQAIMGKVGLLMKASPNTSEEEAFRHFAMTDYGLSSTAAMGMYRGTMGGGRGGGGGGGGAALAEAQYNTFIGAGVREQAGYLDRLGLQSIGGRIVDKARDVVSDSSTQFAIGGAAIGAFTPAGAWGGAAIGYGVGKLYNFLDQGGLGLGLSSGEQADRERLLHSGRIDALESRVRQKHGLLPFDRESYTRIVRGRVDTSNLRLSTAGVDPYGVVGGQMTGLLGLAGVSSVAEGPGTVQLGDRFFNASDVVSAGGIDDILSDKGLDRSAVAAADGWVIDMKESRAKEVRRLRALWGKVLGTRGDRQSEKLGEFTRGAEALLSDSGLPSGLRLGPGGGIGTAERRQVLENLLNVDIKAIGKLPGSVRGTNLVGFTIKSVEKQHRDVIEANLRASLRDATEGLGISDAEIRGQVSNLIRSKAFSKELIRGGRSGSFDIGALTTAASKAGVDKPASLAKTIASDPVLREDLKDIIKNLPSLGTDPEELLGLKSSSSGRGGRKKKSTRSGDQFQGAFNPIGFGQMESSLSRIDQSIRKTATMIDRIDKRMRRGGGKAKKE